MNAKQVACLRLYAEAMPGTKKAAPVTTLARDDEGGDRKSKTDWPPR